MTELREKIARLEEALRYEIENYERALQRGSFAAADRVLTDAAKYASIITALRAMLPAPPAPTGGQNDQSGGEA